MPANGARSLLFRLLLPLLSAVLPAVVLLGALRTLRGLEQEKDAFLRSRAAGIAAWIETLESPEQLPGIRARLLDEDPTVVGIDLYSYEDAASGAPDALRERRELFQIDRVSVDGEEVFRVWLPCHLGSEIYLARLDLAEEAAASLIRPARQNVWFASAGALGLIGLSLALAWSARRAARAEQRQLELEHLARIGQMSAVLAHEIRNPLGTIKGFAQLLGERARDEHSDLLDPILSETTRLENLVRDLLLYGRPPQVQYQEVSIPELAAAVRAHAGRWIGDRPARLRLEAPEIGLVSDPALLEPALLNLVKNAIEAVLEKPDGEVRLAFAAHGATLEITVADNGPGLPEEIRRQLYEPFRTTKASGTGLGLAITRKLVASIGGKLEIFNQRHGGVQAVIRLPMEPKHGYTTDTRRG